VADTVGGVYAETAKKGVGHASLICLRSPRGASQHTDVRPASAQSPLFHTEAEAEKVLHYLSTISADALVRQYVMRLATLR
jgi:hypothetical protein